MQVGCVEHVGNVCERGGDKQAGSAQCLPNTRTLKSYLERGAG